MADKEIKPLRTPDLQLAEHVYRRHAVTVSGKLTPEQLTDSDLWVNVAPKINPGDEIRALADDDSFVVYLLCTYRAGQRVNLKILHGYELEQVSADVVDQGVPYEIAMRGPKKWCIIEKATGNVVQELIPTKADAEKQLDDLLRALAA